MPRTRDENAEYIRIAKMSEAESTIVNGMLDVQERKAALVRAAQAKQEKINAQLAEEAALRIESGVSESESSRRFDPGNLDQLIYGLSHWIPLLSSFRAMDPSAEAYEGLRDEVGDRGYDLVARLSEFMEDIGAIRS